MKLKILALDYDGTIAEHGVLVPEARLAIDRARAAGLTIVLVTGRILGDLRHVVGDLTFVDVVIAENGAVIAFPRSGRSTVLHDPPAPAFLDELARRGVEITRGDVVVEADASFAHTALGAIRDLEQPLSLIFNRSRMMILPQAVNKATGFAAALDALRLSPHNALAIGDAENDHELLRSAEIGVAVEWGSPALKRQADEILPGNGPRAVAHYIEALAARTAEGRGLHMRRPRRRILLGTTDDGHLVSLAVSGRNVVISGDPRSGKSWVAGLMCEQLILQGYSLYIIDPEGDYTSLEALPRVTIAGGDDPPPKPHELLRLLRRPDRSVVLDLSQLSHPDKLDYLRGALPQIMLVRQRTGLPHRLLIDEAHYFLRGSDARTLVDLDPGGCTAITYLASRLHQDVLRAADVMIVSRVTDPDEVAALARACGASAALPEWTRILGELTVDQIALLPSAEESDGRLQRIRLVERLTSHVRHRMKYLDVPVDDRHAFVFTHRGRPTGERAHTLNEFVSVLARTGPEDVDAHVQHGDFSQWIGDVFGDRLLASTVRQLEANYRVNRMPDINGAIAQAVRSRYVLEGEGG